MTGWDISPSGVQSILSLVGQAADELSEAVQGYGKSAQSAAVSAGTISGPSCGNAPVGPVGAAVANFVTDTEYKVKFMGARTRKTMEGTIAATTEYVEGDLRMAADAQREASKAPTTQELNAVAGKRDGK
ncbi:DUF6507 family protein [Streptomyces plumbiresistens]|uniref:DUF6507 family protein n=1 Tax=Streptomyces plumbiresistens TaxID=511811 RepID=UPI0031ED28EB